MERKTRDRDRRKQRQTKRTRYSKRQTPRKKQRRGVEGGTVVKGLQAGKRAKGGR